MESVLNQVFKPRPLWVKGRDPQAAWKKNTEEEYTMSCKQWLLKINPVIFQVYLPLLQMLFLGS